MKVRMIHGDSGIVRWVLYDDSGEVIARGEATDGPTAEEAARIAAARYRARQRVEYIDLGPEVPEASGSL